MIRIFKHYVPSALLLVGLVELLLIGSSYAAAVAIRAVLADLDSFTIERNWGSLLIFTATMSLSMLATGGYRTDSVFDSRVIFVRLIISLLASLVIISLVSYSFGYIEVWRSVFLIAALLSVSLVLLNRKLFSSLVNLDLFRRRILVLGAGENAKKILDLMEEGPNRRFTIVDFVVGPGGTQRLNCARQVNLDTELVGIAEEKGVDEIVVAVDDRRGAMPVQSLLALKARGYRICDLASFFERERGYVDLQTLSHSWLIFSDGFVGGRGAQRLVKRGLDILISVAFLLFTLPILVVTAIAVKLSSPGPILYSQERVGLFGRPYRLYKFRSMRQDAEKDGKPQWAQKGDPRVTSVGRIIRLTRIDEIPQVLNVLRGDMSFVGPRPERPFFVDQLRQSIPFYEERHHVKPGITGWAQLNYPYGATEEDARHKLEYDLYYIKNYSNFLDLLILISTVRVVLFADGAR